MASPVRWYIAKETTISVVINTIITALFMFAVFGRDRQIGLWGAHGLAVDFIPQTFMISALSVLVPTLLTRKRLRSGVLKAPPQNLSRSPRNVALRAVGVAVGLTLLLGGSAVIILSFVWSGSGPFWQVFPYKLAYGAVVALIATPIGLKAALAEPV